MQVAKALQHTNVKLTWDEDDPERKKAFARKLTEDKLKDEDFAAYMADSQSDDSDVEEDDAPEFGKPAPKPAAAPSKPAWGKK